MYDVFATDNHEDTYVGKLSDLRYVKMRYALTNMVLAGVIRLLNLANFVFIPHNTLACNFRCHKWAAPESCSEEEIVL